MKRGAMGAAALATVLLIGGRASADEVPPAATAQAAPGPEEGSHSLGMPYQPRNGFFLEGQVGLFTAFGGEKSASNGQLYTALQLGGKIPVGNATLDHVDLFLSVGLGFNDGDCHILESGADPASGGCLATPVAGNSTTFGTTPENFALVPIDVGVRLPFAHIAFPWFFPYATVGIGAALAAPGVTQPGLSAGLDFNVGLGLEYDTHIPGLNFGIEVLFRGSMISYTRPAFTDAEGSFPGTSGSLFLPYLTAVPRFQYVF